MWPPEPFGATVMVGGVSSYIEDLCELFNISQPSNITWAHAVDSMAELKELADAMFYESDAGALSADNRVIMCHYPSQTTSDLYLDHLLSQAEERNVGVKIDIKLERLVKPIGYTVAAARPEIPVWFNADVFGPKKKMPLKALADVATEDTVLSLGFIGNTFGEKERYDIITQLKDSGLLSSLDEITCRHITFAFSARLALTCTSELVKLLEGVPGSSLTLWTGVGDPRGLSKLDILKLRHALPMKRVFLDIKTQTWLGWFTSWMIEWA
ncbi:hypothetical protein FOL47_006396 [Perkinsus chesapeaki]|uniref:Menorin-like domain-containing protein n=1 Tax=Perkinsus chesapeaki TaxID=330153 RepID=A0A7J6LSI5_PERCH|nr:hypothetical protein FOL47_006396 [Perkinsus chesapeaki]